MLTYVSFVSDKIFLDNVPEINKEFLCNHSAVNTEKNNWIIPFSDKNELAKLFTELRDLGFLFSTGRDWSPAEIFEELRDKGLLIGEYEKISWYGKDKYKIIKC